MIKEIAIYHCVQLVQNDKFCVQLGCRLLPYVHTWSLGLSVTFMQA